MNSTKGSSAERFSAQARELAAKEILRDASASFASYLRVSGNFFSLCAAKFHFRVVEFLRVRYVQSTAAPLNVAFV